MKAGDWVRVYTDPFTEKHIEGRAKLIHKEDEDDFFERWLVRFQKENFAVSRRIKKEHNAQR